EFGAEGRIVEHGRCRARRDIGGSLPLFQMQTEREQVAQHDLKTKLGMVSAGRVLDGWIVDIDGKVDAAATVGRDAGGVEAGARLEAVRERFGCGQRVSGGAEFLIV